MNVHVWHGHARRVGVLAGCTALVLGLTGTAAQAHTPAHRDPARQTLPAGDGWASHGTGTTGGAAADAAHVRTVTDWAQFTAALTEGGDAPRIIKVKGTIDAVADGCDALAVPGYDFDAYLEAYAPRPGAWNVTSPASPTTAPKGCAAPPPPTRTR